LITNEQMINYIKSQINAFYSYFTSLWDSESNQEVKNNDISVLDSSLPSNSDSNNNSSFLHQARDAFLNPNPTEYENSRVPIAYR
jgi:hypothetical protein